MVNIPLLIPSKLSKEVNNLIGLLGKNRSDVIRNILCEYISENRENIKSLIRKKLEIFD